MTLATNEDQEAEAKDLVKHWVDEVKKAQTAMVGMAADLKKAQDRAKAGKCSQVAGTLRVPSARNPADMEKPRTTIRGSFIPLASQLFTSP